MRKHRTDGSPCWCNPVRIKPEELEGPKEEDRKEAKAE